MMTRFGHVALKLNAVAGVIGEESSLAVTVEVARQEDARSFVVHAQQQAVAVRVLAGRRSVVMERRLAADLRFEGCEYPNRDAAVAAVEARICLSMWLNRWIGVGLPQLVWS